jgi:hypothetical protein
MKTAERTKWTYVSWHEEAANSDVESSEEPAESGEERHDVEVEVGAWVQNISKNWQHPLQDWSGPDAFLGFPTHDTVSTDEKHSDKCNSEQHVAEKDSADKVKVVKRKVKVVQRARMGNFGKMRTEVFQDFRKQPRDISLALTNANIPLLEQPRFRNFLLEQGNDKVLEQCKRDDSFSKFIDDEFDKENAEHNKEWSEITKEDDDDDLLWFHRSHPIGLKLQQDPNAYVPMPFRVLDGDENNPDRSNKQVKISNLASWVQSEQLKDLFLPCCNGRFDKVHVPSECGTCCTRYNCSGKWKECKDPVSRGFAYITFYEHKHAQAAIDKFNGKGMDNLVMSVTWANQKKNANTLGSAPAEPTVRHDYTPVTGRAQQACTKVVQIATGACRRPESTLVEVNSDFQFEGEIKGLDGCPRGKLSMGVIQLSPQQLQLLQRHPLWQDGFKSDVFWHRNDCTNRETRRQGDRVTFTVTVGVRGDGMQAQHVLVQQ